MDRRYATFAAALLLGCSDGFSTGAGAGGAGGGAGGGTGDPTTSYGYRRQVSIETEDALEVDYSIRLKIDHGKLVEEGKARADGDDVRIFAEADGMWSELPRVAEEAGWAQKDTLLWFALPEAIGAATTDDRYWLFYGDPEATSAPDDPSEVFAFWDGFDEDVEGWTRTSFGSEQDAHGVDQGLLRLTTRSGYIEGNKDSFLFYRRQFSGNFAAETRVVGKGGGLNGAARLGGVMVRASLNEGARNHTISPVHDEHVRVASLRLGDDDDTDSVPNDEGDETLPAMVRVVRVGNRTQSSWSADSGTSWKPLGDGQFDAVLETYEVGIPLATGSITVGDIPDAGYVEVDWFRIRHEVGKVPTPTLGAEEAL